MRRQFLLLLVGLSVPAASIGSVATGCSEVIVITSEDGGLGGDASHDAKPSSSVGIFNHDAGKDALVDYIDPGCPDAGAPVTDFQCDPYKQGNGNCPPGEGCFIFVKYPDHPCGKETYGAVCVPPGPGGQGDACMGAQDCGGGFVCVVSGSGNQCVELCKLSGDNTCPVGLVCEPIDVEGFGGCL